MRLGPCRVEWAQVHVELSRLEPRYSQVRSDPGRVGQVQAKLSRPSSRSSRLGLSQGRIESAWAYVDQSRLGPMLTRVVPSLD